MSFFSAGAAVAPQAASAAHTGPTSGTYVLARRVDAQHPGPVRYMTQVIVRGLVWTDDLRGKFALTNEGECTASRMFLRPGVNAGPALSASEAVSDLRKFVRLFDSRPEATMAARQLRWANALVCQLRQDAYNQTVWLDPVEQLLPACDLE